MNSEEEELLYRIESIRHRIQNAAVKSGRVPEDITLIAASKMNDASKVKSAIYAGIKIFGENRVQELLDKYEQNAYNSAELHFIGTLQSNKIKYLLGKVSLIQSVSSIKLGQAIDKEAAKQGITQNVLLEINIGRETSKSGILPEEVVETLTCLSTCQNLHILGLMAIPPVPQKSGDNNRYFADMHELFVDISTKKYDNVSMNHLSMGMSNDFEDAILQGSNMVRIGSAIFGERKYS